MYDEYQTRQFWNMKKSELKNIIKEEIREAFGMEKLKQAGEEFLAQDPDRVEMEKKSNVMFIPPSSIQLWYTDDAKATLYKVKTNGQNAPNEESVLNFINRLTGLNTNFKQRPDADLPAIEKALSDKGIDFELIEFDAS